MKQRKEIIKTKTVKTYIHDTISDHIAEIGKMVQTYSLDTTTDVPVNITMNDRDTTLAVTTTVRTSFAAKPFYEFYNTEIVPHPIRFDVPYQEKILIDKNRWWVQLYVGNCGGVGVGYSSVGMGTLFVPPKQQVYYFIYRINL